MNDVNKAIERIHKLLALARDGGATEAEAELAMTKAQELMAEHNLSMATLEAKGGKKEARVKQAEDVNLMYAWKRELLEQVTKVNFCHVSVIQKRNKVGQKIGGGYEIIGRESNVIATRNMFAYLLQSIERFVVGEVGTNMHDRYTKAMHSFRLGASDRLRERLQERHDAKLEAQAKEAREATVRNKHPGAASSNALVVVLKDFAQDEEDLNNDMVNGWEPGKTKRRRDEYEARQVIRAAELETKKAEGIALGLTDDEAWFYANGYSIERAKELCAESNKPQKPETDAQRRKREERDRNYERRERSKQWNADRKVDWIQYRRGVDKADSVGFDDQVGKNDRNKIGGKS